MGLTESTTKFLCDLIRQCGEAGVHTISFNGIEIDFFSQKKETKEYPVYSPMKLTPGEGLSFVGDDDNLNEEDSPNRELNDEELIKLNLEDPLKYEDYIKERLIDAESKN
jgi:hypothetical protein